MDILSIIIIGIGLAMDCFAVSVSKEFVPRNISSGSRFVWLYCLDFSKPHANGLGASFAKQMMSLDHWLAFALLSLIGGKMLYEGLQPEDPDCSKINNFP